MHDDQSFGSSDDPISELLDDFISRRRRGETPSLSAICNANPELANELRQLVPLVDRIETANDDALTNAVVPDNIGEYRILGEIGRGAMGVVYRANHQSLDREVALKVLTRIRSLDDTAHQRFRQEARAAARLQHKNIVPVFDVGEADGFCFFTMQLIDGVPLSQVSIADVPDSTSTSNELGTQLRDRWRVLANILAQAADGLAHAHNRGVVHRDIKPSNLILDKEWNLWVGDFGLAKLEDVELTGTGDLPGTLRYMAPERLRGKCDERADTYGLGASIFEVCTGHPLVSGKDRASILHALANGDRDTSRMEVIPRDLQAIIYKCVEENPDRRYAAAELLALDLRRFADGQAVHARRVSDFELALRWADKHRIFAGSVAVALLSMVLATVGFARLAYVQSQQHKMAEASRLVEKELRSEADRFARDANDHAKENRRLLYLAEMNLGSRLAQDANGIGLLNPILKTWDGGNSADSEWTSWELDYLRTIARNEVRTVRQEKCGEADSPERFACTKDKIAFVEESDVAIADAMGNRIARIPIDGDVTDLHWSPGGQYLAILKEQGTVVVFRDEEPIAKLAANAMDAVEWSGENELVVLAKNSVRTWNILNDETERFELQFAGGTLHAGARWVVKFENRIYFAETNADNMTQITSRDIGRHFTVAVHPSEPKLAVARGDTVALLDMVSGEYVNRIEAYRGRVVALSWNVSGTALAVVGPQGLIKVWDLRRTSDTNVMLRTKEFSSMFAANSPINDIEFVNDYKIAFSVFDAEEADSQLGILELGNERARQIVNAMTAPSSRHSLCWDDGPEPTCFLADRNSGLISITAGKTAQTIDSNPISAVAVSLDGQNTATVNRQGQLRIYRQDVAESKQVEGQFSDGLVWDSGGHLFGLTRDGRILRCNSDLSEQRFFEIQSQRVRQLSYSAATNVLAVPEMTGRVRFFSADTDFKLLSEIDIAGDSLMGIDFSPDGAQFVAAHSDTVSIWEIETGRVLQEMRGHSGGVFSVSWHPTESRVASGSVDRTVRLWDLRTGKSVFAFEDHRSPVQSIAWSPDGKTLASVGARCHLVLRSIVLP